eukprot:TRINITY_DN40968_c0_g1_i1.p1 TRINITY_DN40968_c0_g1~~TRINITY_DN40968_c0_g1_i1.p1  ORF type:complete len:464 (+),score=85.51 TRINITY_DN40968_c0_g1_i1:170-1393(+)
MEFLKMNADNQRVQLKENGETYIKAFLHVIEKVQTDPKIVKYFALLLEGIVQDDTSKIQIFAKMQKNFKNKTDVIGILLHFLISSAGADSDVKDSISHLLAQVLATVGFKGFETVCKDFLIWVINAQQSKSLSTYGTTKSLMALLKIGEVLKQFAESGGLRKLVRILQDEGEDMQISYNVIACIWLLSFKPLSIPYFEDRKNEAIDVIIKTLQMFRREKIVRIVLHLFRNLANSEKCIEMMLDNDLLKEINNLINRHWVDKDIINNLEKLEKTLSDNYKVLNNFEKFKKQVTDGLLKWGPIHSDTFWSEHVKFCEDNDFEIVKKLIALLRDERPLNNAIACYDIGQFARFHPFGRNVLEKLGAKLYLLELMESQDSSVRENALISIQKYMISDWQQFSKQIFQSKYK